MASSGIVVFPSFKMGVTSTGSHLMGAYNYFSPQFFGARANKKNKLYLCGSKNILHGLRNFGTDAVTLNQGDCVLSLLIKHRQTCVLMIYSSSAEFNAQWLLECRILHEAAADATGPEERKSKKKKS